jgi:hypothetical protein
MSLLIIIIIIIIVIIIIIIVVVVVVSCHVPFLPGTSPEPAVTPHHSGCKFHTAALSVLCVMFPVQLSAAVNMSNVFLVQLPDFFLMPFGEQPKRESKNSNTVT